MTLFGVCLWAAMCFHSPHDIASSRIRDPLVYQVSPKAELLGDPLTLDQQQIKHVLPPAWVSHQLLAFCHSLAVGSACKEHRASCRKLDDGLAYFIVRVCVCALCRLTWWRLQMQTLHASGQDVSHYPCLGILSAAVFSISSCGFVA